MLRLGPVLGRKGIDAEIAVGHIAQELRQPVGLLREVGNGHLGYHPPHEFPLGRVVVHEDHAVEPDVELGRQLADIARFVAPVDAPRGEIITPQHQFRVALPHLEHVGLVVLAAHGQDHPRAGQFADALLEEEVGIARIVAADADALGALFAQHTAPQRIVEVEYKALAPLHEGRPALRGEPVPEIGLQPWADRRPRKEPVAPVDPLAAGITPEEGGEIEHADIRACGRKGIQRGIVTRHGRTQGTAAALDRQHIRAGQREEVAHAGRTDAVEHQPQAIDVGVGLADLRPDVTAHGQGIGPDAGRGLLTQVGDVAVARAAHPFGAEEGLDGGIPENEQVGHNGRYSARGEMRQLRKTL